MKDLLCKAFCESLAVTPVPAGFAVRTPYANADGDPLLIYFVRDGRGRWRIEDDGTQVAFLEACGVDIGGRARGEVFQTLLQEHDVQFDTDSRTIYSPPLSEAELGTVAVRFAALLLRLQDLALLSPQIIRNTFREDVIAAIKATFSGLATVEDSTAIAHGMMGQEADLVISAPSAPPLGVFLGTSEENALHALVAKMEIEKYLGVDGHVALIVERSKNNPIREGTFALAFARLDAVLSFRESKEDTMLRLGKLVGLNNVSTQVRSLM